MNELWLSNNFPLSELLMTNHREFDEQQYNPPQEVIDNLGALCRNILQPLRNEIDIPIFVNSGYRCKALNDAIKGELTSQHLLGQAADIVVHKKNYSNAFLYMKILEMKLPFDQLINEFNYRWVHVSYSPRIRRMVLKSVYDPINGRTKYIKG
jgi:zinc D-Ala-D-Ala carboxypeptidase